MSVSNNHDREENQTEKTEDYIENTDLGGKIARMVMLMIASGAIGWWLGWYLATQAKLYLKVLLP